MKPQTIEIRCKTLSHITKLVVHAYTKNGVVYFQFISPAKTIATVCTYRKAKMFAEGFAAGKRHYEFLHKRTSLLSKLSAAIQKIKARATSWRSS